MVFTIFAFSFLACLDGKPGHSGAWDVASLNRLAILNYKINSTLRYGFDNLCLRGGSPFFLCVNNLHAYCRRC